MPAGRPSEYTDAVAMEICTRLAEGESLRAICQDEHMPNRITVIRWLAKEEHAEFRHQYACAREAQADHLAEEIVQIADDGRNDTYVTDAGRMTDYDVIARSKLRVDARKWYASKLAPKKYSEKHALEHTGKDGAPLPAPVNTVQAGVLIVPGVLNDPTAWTALVQTTAKPPQ